ncbi:protein kinase domain-containing protein [Gordonia desulfuricans]|nr:protein kinase [Gordonia desulfuricans]
MTLVDGQEFAGYRIVGKLGAGGMGEVYLAAHPRLPRQDALKVLSATMSADENFRRRFIREADLAAGLDHPNIVGVYDRGEHDGQLWITMRYVEGRDAADALLAHPRGLPVSDVEEIVTAVADALDHAHAQKLLHRDVKPANILLTDAAGPGGRRRVLLADFGIARPMVDDTRLTATNFTVGSFAYSSPEQLAGETLDGRTDQYSLACTAYQLLSGSTPFDSSNAAAMIRRHLSSPPPPITTRRPELSTQVDQVLFRALDKDPRRRYPSCTAFATDLAAALTGPGSSDRPSAATLPPRPDLTKQPSSDGRGTAHPAPSPTPQPFRQSSTPQPFRQSSTPQPFRQSSTPQPFRPSVHPGSAAAQPTSARPYTPQTQHTPAPSAHSPSPYSPSPYSPAPYSPGAYPPPPAPTPSNSPARRNAILALVLSLAAIPGSCLFGVGGIVLSGVGIYFAIANLRLTSDGPAGPGAEPTHRGMAISGLVIGIITLLWSILLLIGFIGSLSSGS